MSEPASAGHASYEPWRPNLTPLVALLAVACTLSSFFMYNTYVVRQPAHQQTADGRLVILRLAPPGGIPVAIVTSGSQLNRSIIEITDEINGLHTDLSTYTEEQRQQLAVLSDLVDELSDAETMLESLQQKLGALGVRAPRNAGKTE